MKKIILIVALAFCFSCNKEIEYKELNFENLDKSIDHKHFKYDLTEFKIIDTINYKDYLDIELSEYKNKLDTLKENQSKVSTNTIIELNGMIRKADGFNKVKNDNIFVIEYSSIDENFFLYKNIGYFDKKLDLQYSKKIETKFLQ